MFNKLFGGKKSKDGYYMQLDEAADAQSSNNNGKKAAVVEEKPKAVVEEKPKAESAPVKAVVEDKKTENVKATESATKTSKKKKSAKSKSKTETASVAPTPKKVPDYEPPFWVQAMNATTSNGNGKTDAVESFAANNLMPLNRSRRRPGPSLNPFMDMARQVKKF